MRLLPILIFAVAVVGCSNPQPQPAQPEYTAEQFTPTQLQQDLDTLFTYLDGLHPNLYHKAPKAEWLATKDSIRAGLTTNLNRAEFYMRLLPLFQLEQDGHTFVNYPMSYSDTLHNQGHGFFPFKVRFRDRHIYLQEDHSKQEVPAYAELVSINGRAASEIVQDFEQIESMDRYAPLEPYMSYFFKHLLYPMYGWGGQYEITYQHNDSTFTTTVQGISLSDFPSKPFHYWNYTTHADSGFALLDLNLCEDYEPFLPFCDSVFTDLNAKQIPNLVLDLRGNTGGTTRHGDTLLTYLTDQPFTQYGAVERKHSTLTNSELDSSYLEVHSQMMEPHAVDNPNRYEGNVFVLTDEITFSSAAILAGTVQCFDIGTVIGRETGGTQIMYSSFYDLYLPNTGLFVGISTDRRHIPCGQYPDRGVIPDHIIEYNISDLKNDRDLELEKVLELIGQEIQEEVAP